MSLLVATVVKTTIVIGAALAVRALLRRHSASVRHWLLAMAVACALLMPVLALVAPTWQVPVIRSVERPIDAGVEVSVQTRQSPVAISPGRATRLPEPDAAFDTGRLVVTLWLAGTVLALATLLIGLARLAVIAAAARRAGPGRCVTLAAEIARAYGLRRPVRLLYGDHPAMLATWGLIRPTVILPESARAWTDDRLRVVLCHELAHIHRGDWGTQLAAELLRAVYWFNPFAWIACRRLRLDSEHACDDAVLNAGVAASAYATHLIDLARACSLRRAAWSPALPVARPSGLERRVRAMLNTHLDRHPATRRTRIVTGFAFLALAVSLAGVASLAQGPFATVAGSITDQMRAALANATLAITNTETQARNEVRSDRSGRFELVGLPPGDYVLEANLIGFTSYRGMLTLNGQQVDRAIVMNVSTLQERVTVTESDEPPRAFDPEAEERIGRRRVSRAAQRAAECPAVQPDSVSTGGKIRPPWKLVDVRPEYPPRLREEKIGGTVDLEARIGTDGTVKEVRPDPAAHPDLARAAVDAVREWRFDETLLNCVPIEVSMTVRVTFRPRQ